MFRKSSDENISMNWRPILRSVPMPDPAAKVERHSETELRVTVKKRKPGLFFRPVSWILQPPSEETLVVEGIGLEIWDLVDGRRNVEQIVELFACRHRLTFHESRVAVTEYLKTLVRRGALTIDGSNRSA